MTQDQNSTPALISTEGKESPSRTGPQPSGHGAVTTASSRLKEALGRMDSDQVRREVRALCDQRWPFLQRTVDGEYNLTGFTAVDTLTDTQREEVRSVARVLLRPADRETVTMELTRCLSLTKSRAKGEEDMTAFIAAMVDELSAYPRDVVVSALRDWSRKETFWPSLSELLMPIKRATAWRRSLEDAAGQVGQGYMLRPSSPGNSWKNLPPERKAMINDALRAIGITEPME